MQFPALAAWLIVAGGGALFALVAFGGRQFFKRLDGQDETLKAISSSIGKEVTAIKDLLASEIQHLRDMQHDIDKRVVSLEAYMGASYLGRGRARAPAKDET